MSSPALSIERESALTCHHLRPACHGKLVSNPALTILPLIPAPSKRPKTVRRNNETTSWSRGESRSAGARVNERGRVALISPVTYGSSVPPHLPLYQSLYLGPCHLEWPRRRWADSGSDTIALYRRGTAWKGCPGCPGGGWRNLSRNICLSFVTSFRTRAVSIVDRNTNICRNSWPPTYDWMRPPSEARVTLCVSNVKAENDDGKSDLHETYRGQ